METGGITEFVPLPFVDMEAPRYLRGKARQEIDFAADVMWLYILGRIFPGETPNRRLNARTNALSEA